MGVSSFEFYVGIIVIDTLLEILIPPLEILKNTIIQNKNGDVINVNNVTFTANAPSGAISLNTPTLTLSSGNFGNSILNRGFANFIIQDGMIVSIPYKTMMDATPTGTFVGYNDISFYDLSVSSTCPPNYNLDTSTTFYSQNDNSTQQFIVSNQNQTCANIES